MPQRPVSTLSSLLTQFYCVITNLFLDCHRTSRFDHALQSARTLHYSVSTVNSAIDLPLVPSGKLLKEHKPPKSSVSIRTGEWIRKTHSVGPSLAPVWNSTFILCVSSSLHLDASHFGYQGLYHTISLAVFHEGRKRPRLLCETNITIRKLLESQQGKKGPCSLWLISPS